MSKQRLAWWIGGIAISCLFVWFVPLVRFQSLRDATTSTTPGGFDARELAEQLWNEKLEPSFDEAHYATIVLAAIESDPAAARTMFGRTMGMSKGFMVFLRGKGTIIAIERSKIAIALDDESEPAILLDTGPIFGNAVRDAVALIEFEDVANSQEFNAVSAELNRLVEERVLPALKSDAAVGKPIEFVGCAEVKDPARFMRPLKITPVFIACE